MPIMLGYRLQSDARYLVVLVVDSQTYPPRSFISDSGVHFISFSTLPVQVWTSGCDGRMEGKGRVEVEATYNVVFR